MARRVAREADRTNTASCLPFLSTRRRTGGVAGFGLLFLYTKSSGVGQSGDPCVLTLSALSQEIYFFRARTPFFHRVFFPHVRFFFCVFVCGVFWCFLCFWGGVFVLFWGVFFCFSRVSAIFFSFFFPVLFELFFALRQAKPGISALVWVKMMMNYSCGLPRAVLTTKEPGARKLVPWETRSPLGAYELALCPGQIILDDDLQWELLL